MSVYPWSAVVGQAALKQALLLCAIDPAIGGVLVQGPRGVAKTTLARALGQLVAGPFVELPLGATEERITGTLDLEAALRERRVEFAPGLLSRAHEGVLYVDEVNLLSDGLVDLLLDAAATGKNVVERDGVSHTHPARFVLVGTMNPEEGELRPQLIDRFGLCVHAEAEIAPAERAEIVRRRLEFDRDAEAFGARFADEQRAFIERCRLARSRVATIALDGSALERVTERCYAARVEGVRADLAMLRAARAHAAWQGRSEIRDEDVDAVAELALAHRRGKPAAPSGGGSGGGASGRTADQQTTPGAHQPQARTHARISGGSAAAAHARQPAGADSSHAEGAMLPVPVRASARPRLPTWIVRSRPTPRQQAHARRRGRAQLSAAGGARGRSSSRDGSIDWFATLLENPAPRRADLQRRARRGAAHQLWILVLDCSASMLRDGALAAAKGAAHAFEARANRAGAHVALISFRGDGAHTEVTSRAGRAVLERGIAALSGGGGTPLKAALLEAVRVSELQRWRSAAIAKRLVLLTDGRSREDLSDLSRRTVQLDPLVIDCERGRLRLGRAPQLASALGGTCHHVDDLS
jgi:magnesium chelatase subunit D